MEPDFGPNWPKWDPKLGFCHFLKFGSLVFLEIAYNNSFQHCITSSRGKTHTKNFFETTFAPERANIGPETRLLAIFSSLVH